MSQLLQRLQRPILVAYSSIGLGRRPQSRARYLFHSSGRTTYPGRQLAYRIHLREPTAQSTLTSHSMPKFPREKQTTFALEPGASRNLSSVTDFWLSIDYNCLILASGMGWSKVGSYAWIWPERAEIPSWANSKESKVLSLLAMLSLGVWSSVGRICYGTTLDENSLSQTIY